MTLLQLYCFSCAQMLPKLWDLTLALHSLDDHCCQLHEIISSHLSTWKLSFSCKHIPFSPVEGFGILIKYKYRHAPRLTCHTNTWLINSKSYTSYCIVSLWVIRLGWEIFAGRTFCVQKFAPVSVTHCKSGSESPEHWG